MTTIDQPVSNQRLTVTITVPTFGGITKSLSFADLGFNCIMYSVIERSPTSATSIEIPMSPVVSKDEPTEIILTLTNNDGDYTGWACTYKSYEPLDFVLKAEVADAVIPPDEPIWLLGAVYHANGMHISTMDPLPPLSIEYVPSSPNTLKFTLYQIENGLFDLSRVVISFAQMLNPFVVFSNPQLIFTPDELRQYPSLSAATTKLDSVPGYGVETYYLQKQLSIDGIPFNMKQVSFTLDLDQPAVGINALKIRSYLREQQNEGFSGGINTSNFRQYLITKLQNLNTNGLTSIEPSIKFVPKNGFRLNFSSSMSSSTLGTLTWPTSSLTSLIYILECGNLPTSPTAPTIKAPDVNFSRGGWSVSVAAGASNPDVPALLYCEVYVSGLIAQLDKATLLQEYLFENLSNGLSLSSFANNSPPHSPSVRAGFLDSLLQGVTPITTNVTHWSYFSRSYTFTDIDGTLITLIGTRHTVKVNFPGLFYHSSLSITPPPYVQLTSRLFKKDGNDYFIDMSNFKTTIASSTTDPTLPPVIDLMSDLPLKISKNSDGSTTWTIETGNLVDKTALAYNGIDVIDFSFEFDIYRPMSREYDGIYPGKPDENVYYYIDNDSNKVPSDLGSSLSLNLQQYSALGLPDTPLPNQTRQFIIPTPKFDMTLPPNFVIVCTKNVATEDTSAYNTSFELVISKPFGDSVGTLIKGDFISLTIGSSWSTEFKFTNISPLPPTETLLSMESISESTVVFKIEQDLTLDRQRSVQISLLWLTPCPTMTSPSFSAQLISSNPDFSPVNYTFAPYFIGVARVGLATHSIIPQIKPSPLSTEIFTSELPIPLDSYATTCYTSHPIITSFWSLLKCDTILSNNSRCDWG